MRTVLFLCTGNSCRSQMAEGFARELLQERLIAYSAGIETHGLNPYAVQVMQEAGIDITNQRSQHISEFDPSGIDYVITVCSDADANCPIFPARVKVIHHGFDDPPRLAREYDTEEEKLECYRRVRDEIKSYILTLPDALEG